MIQLGHNFAYVTTAQLSWHVQKWDLFGSLLLKLEQFFYKISIIIS